MKGKLEGAGGGHSQEYQQFTGGFEDFRSSSLERMRSKSPVVGMYEDIGKILLDWSGGSDSKFREINEEKLRNLKKQLEEHPDLKAYLALRASELL